MKTKSFEQVLKESSPAVKKAYKKELKKLKPSIKKKELSKRERIAKDNAIYKEEHEQYLKDVASCEHICSGNCRRNGCNCKCGEFCQRVGAYLPPKTVTSKTVDRDIKVAIKALKENSERNRFADKDFSRFAPENLTTHRTRSIVDKAKTTAFLGEIEGEPAINCDKWTAMCVVLVLLCVVAYAMHGDYQAVQSNLIH